MAKKRKYDPPETSIGDHAHTLARAGLGSLPYIGSPAVELFASLITPPLVQRQREWMEQIGDGLRALEDKRGVNLDELGNDPAFIDTVLGASQAALRTSEQEKRDALRNAVLNSALPHAPDKSKRQLFINWLDTLTVWHLRLFRLFADPIAWYRAEGKQPPNWPPGVVSLENVLWNAYPDLRHSQLLYDKMMSDLQDEGLTIRGSVHVKPLGGVFDSQATELGKEFLAFIAAPTLD